jgi:ACS family glucarate transporter-like MFS transporter
VIVGVGANWTLALLVLGVAGALGAVCWFFVHAERPLTTPQTAAAGEVAPSVA